jgi:glycosyltransferase involved in cell wall biosynthesis
MKIALLSMDYPPRMAGGTTIHTYQLALALDSLGHQVHVVAASHPDTPREEIKENIHIHRVRRPYSVFSAYRTRSLLKDLDIIHGHGICAYGHLMLNKFPTVVKMHNTWLGEFERYKNLAGNTNVTRKMDSATMMRAYIKMDKTCCKRADHLICISEVIKAETEKYNIDHGKMTVIHNGIDFARFDIKDNYRAKLDLDGTVVGYIGRLEPHKGVESLIKAVKDLDTHLIIVGGGSDEGRLKGLVKKFGIEEKVKFTGYVPYDQVPKYYASVDIVVYPTLYEPLGNVVLESMAAGKPIIATNVDGIPEIFEEGTGFLIKPEQTELEEKLRVLLMNEQLRKKMGEKGKEMVRGHSWVEVAKGTIKVCENVLKN